MTVAVAPRRRQGVRVIEDGDQVMLYHPAHVTHVLNATAYAIWQLCDGTTTRDEMVAGVCELFDVTAAEAGGDVDRILRELDGNGLLETSPSLGS